MPTVAARLNWGRWITECPKGDGGAMEVKPGEGVQFICPICYPQSIAQFVGIINGKIQPAPDLSARRTARKLAEEDGAIYTVLFPDNLAEIEALISARPQQHKNWEPGETLEFLTQENKDNGL